MRRLATTLAIPALLLAPPDAHAHAFLDHATPSVGSTVQRAPAVVRLWFTQALEPAFSTIAVMDQSGQRVDDGKASLDAGDASVLEARLKPLPPGTYKVIWRVVSVDTHATDGDFTFRVAGG